MFFICESLFKLILIIPLAKKEFWFQASNRVRRSFLTCGWKQTNDDALAHFCWVIWNWNSFWKRRGDQIGFMWTEWETSAFLLFHLMKQDPTSSTFFTIFESKFEGYRKNLSEFLFRKSCILPQQFLSFFLLFSAQFSFERAF